MPKYEYPAHIYSGTSSQDDRKLEEEASETSSSEEEEEEFFSNQEFLKGRATKQKAKVQATSNTLKQKNLSHHKDGIGQLREGRAYIEGGSHYQ